MNKAHGLLYFYKKWPFLRFQAICLSFLFHIVVFICIFWIIQNKLVKTLSTEVQEPPAVKVTLNPPVSPPQKPLKEQPLQQPPSEESRPLTSQQPDRPFSIPPKPEKPLVAPNEPQGMEKFLPGSNQEFLNKMRQKAQESKNITGDAGDIPIRGTERRRDVPLVLERWEHKDMSLLQFSQMFHERFGSVWNSKERLVPPESPLRPGDVIYYKVFINPDGTLNHVENLTNSMRPGLNTEHLDRIFEEVLSKTLPMRLPAKLEKNVLVTEIVAVQIVNRSLFMNFGG